MDSLDTNLLVRYYVDDDRAQADITEALLESGAPLFVALSVIIEMVWVLQKTRYRLPKARVVSILRHLLALPNVDVERETAVRTAVTGYEKGLDFADALHLACSETCDRMLTFDRTLAKRAGRLGLAPACEVPT